MGAIVLSGRDVVGYLTDLIGFKLGLAITEDELTEAASGHGLSDVWPDTMDATYRYRSEVMEELCQVMLAAFGDADATHALSFPAVMPQLMREFPDLMDDPGALDYTLKRLPELSPASGTNVIDPRPLFREVEERWGSRGILIAGRLMQIINRNLMASPWSRVRRQDFSSLLELRDLFDSEKLPVPLGLFFDQRFIDFLEANSASLDRMHWRQFEGLVAERLRRKGLRVEIGPGRGDEGIDVRAWEADSDETAPAVMLVQCKRTRDKVDRVVVKALAADVMFEGARSGMVATTSSWSPGARKTVEARGYPVEETNRDTLVTWLTEMRTPGCGAWLAGSGLKQENGSS
ncbi:restriction endonuclease [Streptomyces heilongjiangensis]|uniref:Restriction endonuclease n=1 Tax=Streptomyces heilongjiangensis TaxID=945052 RepID=A0ABW1BIZ4_9ACTN|nr:restriction endonuclease [Streptomyces heilongjiangensis]MDC2951245.1 restriction endonuclease [Streptomyces heilongjiangensis]